MQRPAKAAQAQAQAQRQEEITSVQSLELCKALLRVSIYHVSYLRGIFPDEHYKPVDMRNLDNMEIHMLLPKDAESERLVQWVEGGVAHALERHYLRKVFFGFSRDAAGKDLLEEYVFSFSYDQDGSVHMAAGGSSRSRKEFSTKDPAPKRGPTLNAVKYQVCRLMRMLVELTNTLEQVPEERFLFMKLTYTDDTPDDYEPPMFAPAADGGVGCFSRMPFVMEVGKVDTRHIKVGLAVKTVLDNVEEGADWGEDGHHLPVADDNSNLFQTTEPAPTAATGAGAPSEAASGGVAKGSEASAAPSHHDSAEDESMGGGFSCAAPKGRKGADAGEVVQRPDSASQHSGQLTQREQAELEALCVWILGRPHGQVHMLDAMARFGSLSSSALDACFDGLQQEGVLVPTGEPDCYRVVKPAAKAGPAKAKAPVADSEAAAAAHDEADMAQAMQALRVAPLDSQQGGVHDVPGSQRTMSVAGGKRKPAERQQESSGQQSEEEAEQMCFPETQPSQAGGRRQLRKASVVQDPIQQQGKKRRTAAAAAPAAAPQQPAAVRRSTRRR